MPKSTVTEEEKFKLPKDEPLPAILRSVSEREINFTNKQTGQPDSFTKWAWEFEITDGPYQGLRAWADTESRLTTHPENKVRQFAEAILGAELEVGMDFDTDDILALPCEIVCDNKEHEKKDGTVSYMCPVVQVWPAGTSIVDEGPGF